MKDRYGIGVKAKMLLRVTLQNGCIVLPLDHPLGPLPLRNVGGDAFQPQRFAFLVTDDFATFV
jgi:hypothetical protein